MVSSGTCHVVACDSDGGDAVVAYLVRRTMLGLFTLVIVSFVSFVIVQLPPGDQVDMFLDMVHERGAGVAPGRTMVQVEALRESWGLNRPIVVQWWSWISDIVFHGDFGYSYAHIDGGDGGRDIGEAIREDLPFTIYLSIFTVLITWTFAFPVGIYSAMRQNTIGDYVFTFAGFTGLAVPDFLLGLVLMYVAFAYFGQSVGGLMSQQYLNQPWTLAKVLDLLRHLWIPAVVLGTSGTASLIRIMRNNLLDELGKQYVITARAKGLKPSVIQRRHVLRNAILPVVTLAGLHAGQLVERPSIVLDVGAGER